MNSKSSLDLLLSKFYRSRHFTLYAFAIIAAITLLAYSNTFYSSFHFDDDAQISENHTIKHVTVENIITQLRTSRPVVQLSLMLNYWISGLNVVSWHVFNICVHIINSLLVYLLVLKTLTAPVLKKRYDQRARVMALFAALLFALHPIQTESVTYIISRSELLATLFYLTTFLLFIQSVETGKFIYIVTACFTSLCAMGSKQWAITLPAMILLYDYLFLSQGSLRKVVSRWKAYLLVTLPVSHIFYFTDVIGSSAGAGHGVFVQSSTTGLNAKTYLLTSLNVLWTYVRLLIVPINQNLDYDYRISKTLFEFPTFISLLGHSLVVGILFWVYKKKGWLLIPFGVAWFYVTVSPVQSIVPIVDVIFEHRMYLPSIGLFLAFVVAYEELFEWVGKRTAMKQEPV